MKQLEAERSRQIDELYKDASSWGMSEEVKVKLVAARNKAKVAFLSSQERRLFPDPFNSKFGLLNNPFVDPHLPPYPMLAPKYHLLDKPISNKGYGIGGLSAPRFPVTIHANKIPAPGLYNISRKTHIFPPKVWLHYGLMHTKESTVLTDEATHRKLNTLWGKCHQTKVAFGTSLKETRFPKEKKTDVVGPGHYTLRSYTMPKVPVVNSFLRGPVALKGSPVIQCTYGPKGCCVECGEELMHSADYYRSKLRIALKPLVSDEEQSDRDREIRLSSRNIEASVRKFNLERMNTNRLQRVLMCRECYCKGMRGHSRFWKRGSEIERIFEKTRHCSFIHDHRQLPEHTAKASCKWGRKLKRKEVILNAIWSDKCDRQLVEKKIRYKKDSNKVGRTSNF